MTIAILTKTMTANMLEIAPLSPIYPIKILGKVTKDTRLLELRLRKKKPALETSKTLPAEHIDELV
jgi:hypothetical protein